MELLSYQQAAIDLSRVEPFLIVEHASRIGMTFAFADEAVATASGDNAQSVVYLAPHADMAAEFILQCGQIAGRRGIATDPVASRLEDRRLVLALSFPSGRTITASAAEGRDLTGVAATVIIDQAAWVPGLQALIDQALPMILFGGRVILLSRRHEDPDNLFNLLLKDSIADMFGGAMRIPIGMAIQAGLFRRICALKGEVWSREAEEAWETQLRNLFGKRAALELDLVDAGHA